MSSGGDTTVQGGGRAWLREASAGLANAIASVPDGMATAVLAGAYPMAGLYASIAGPAVGGALASTRVMVVATTSAAAVTASQVMTADPANPARTLANLTALAGLFMLVATWLGFHRLIRFVSASVMGGFLFGIGLVLVLGQLADATGTTTHGSNVAERAWHTLMQWQQFHWPSVATAAAAIALTAAFGKGRLATVGPLIGVLVPTIVVQRLGVRMATVGDVGEITVGLPPLVLPDPRLITPDVIATAVALALVVLVQAAGVGAAYPNADGRPTEVRRDFVAQGAANLASAVVGGIPVGGSVGQTAVNVLAGSRSRWAAIISGIWMLVFVVAAGPSLSMIPMPALAGLLILAGVTSLRPLRLLQSWRSSRSSALAAVVTMLATVVIPVHWAVLLGVLLSLLLVGIHAADGVQVVGLVKEPDAGWRRVDPPAVAPAGEVTVIDIEGPAAFDSAADLFAGLPTPDPAGAGAVVLRMRGHVRPNLTSFLALRQYARAHRASGGGVLVCGLDPEVIRRLQRLGLEEDAVLLPGSDRVNGSLDDALSLALERVKPPDRPTAE